MVRLIHKGPWAPDTLSDQAGITGLQAYALSASGQFQTQSLTGTEGLTLEAVLPVHTDTGDWVFGAARNADEVQVWRLDNGALQNGAAQPTAPPPDSGTDVPGMAHVRVGDADFVLTVDAAASVAGQAFAIVGATASNALSVVRVTEQGQLQVTGHVIDERNTRFDELTTLAVAEAGGAAVGAGPPRSRAAV